MKRKAYFICAALLSLTIVSCGKKAKSSSSSAANFDSSLNSSSSSQALSSSSLPHSHRWGSPTYEWSNDNNKCTAQRVCLDDASHKETEIADSTYAVITPAQCETDGVGRYSASFDNAAFTAQTKDITLTKLGHDLIHHEGKPATCTEKGWLAYDTCSRCAYTSKVELDMLGHKYVRNEETLVYECEHEGCQQTNGRDYEMSITINPIHVGDLYEPRNYEFSFKNDNGDIVFGFISYYIDNSTIISPLYSEDYRFPNSFLGKTVKALIYLGVHDNTTVKITDDRQQIENCAVFCNGQATTKGGRMSANSTYYPSSEPSVIGSSFYNYHYDLGTVLPSENPRDYEYSYQNQSFAFDHASMTSSSDAQYLSLVEQAFNKSQVSFYEGNTLELISDAQFDGSAVVNTPFIKYASIDNLTAFPESNGQFFLSGTCTYTSKLENEETVAINETGGFRRYMETDKDFIRLGFNAGGIGFYLWFAPTGNNAEHYHIHHFVKDESTLEYYCDVEGCEATNGRDYEMTIELPTLHVGDTYDKWDATCTFKNDDGALTFVVVVYEIGDTIVPYIQSGTYVFPNTLVGANITSHVYIGVDDATYVKFNDTRDIITNLQVIHHGEAYSCSGQIGPYPAQNGKTYQQTYHFRIPYGTLQPKEVYNGATPRIDYNAGTAQYGLYPQHVVTDSTLIDNITSLGEEQTNGWWLYDDQYYVKQTAAPKANDYYFDNNQGTIVSGEEYWYICEPITWRILEETDDSYLLLSENILDNGKYSPFDSYRQVTDDKTGSRYDAYPGEWEHSMARLWAKQTFYPNAFMLGNEKVMQVETDFSKTTTDNPQENYRAPNIMYATCDDYVFFLSYQDYVNYNYGFSTDEYVDSARASKTTDFVRSKGIFLDPSNKGNVYELDGYYWTRSVASTSNSPWGVSPRGQLNTLNSAPTEFVGMRPAIRLSKQHHL